MAATDLEDAVRTLRSSAERMSGESRFRYVFEEYQPLEEEDLAEWQSLVREGLLQPDYCIPSALCRLYRVTGGFRFQWQHHSDSGDRIAGSIQLSTLMELYQRDEEMEEAIPELIAEPRLFDDIGGDERVTLRLDPPAEPLRLAHVDSATRVSFPLAIDPVEYVVAAAEYRAIYGWQALFSARAAPDAAVAARLRADLERLFGEGRGR